MASILVAVAMFVLLFQDEKKKKGVNNEIMKIDSSITERLPGGSNVIGCTM